MLGGIAGESGGVTAGGAANTTGSDADSGVAGGAGGDPGTGVRGLGPCDVFASGHADMRTSDGVIHDGVFDKAYFDDNDDLRLCS